MIVPGSANPLLLGQSSGYNLTNSLRFRSSASAYLNRTVGSNGSATTFTWSGWVKRGSLTNAADQWLFSSTNFLTTGSGNPFTFEIVFKGTDAGADTNKLSVVAENNASSPLVLYTTQVFRDPSAWYHIVVAVDTTQATNTNRVKIYVNGTQVTSFSTATYCSQNTAIGINQSGNTPTIGSMNLNGSATRFFDGYQTEINFIDGQALTPSSFGETSTTTGVWQPKRYSGTYGTNGFYLPFTDNSALTTSSNVGLGKDFSGNGNYWTTNNISITSGSTYDSMTDVPTLTSATASNFCTLNPLWYRSSFTFSNANLTATSSTANSRVVGTIGADSGKYYAEVTATGSQTSVGIIPIANAITTNTNEIAYFNLDGNVYKSGVAQGSAAATWGSGDVIGIALNLDSQEVSFYKNNTFQKTVSLATDSNWTFEGLQATTGSSTAITFNFGQRPFAYTPPTGFVALNTYNLPTPTIGATATTQADNYFDVNLYTGNGGGSNTQTISGLGFAPDLAWLKARSSAIQSNLFDTVRGATKGLISSSTSAEITDANSLQSFTSDGYVLGPSTISLLPNYPAVTYVGWNWKANGGTGVTNTAGSITSTVSANTTSGFSVVTYTEPASGSYTVGHGLGVTPSMFILKERDVAGDNWVVWHNYWQSVDPIPTKKGQYLNSTLASFTTGSDWLNSASSTTLGITTGQVTAGGATMVMYAFSEVAGYSKFGSYTGNASADGTFVYTGFKPSFVMIKRTDSTGFWAMLDDARSPYNVADDALYANASNAESTAQATDFTSNGFKLRTTDSDVNASGTYIYMAFAENPFKYSLAR